MSGLTLSYIYDKKDRYFIVSNLNNRTKMNTKTKKVEMALRYFRDDGLLFIKKSEVVNTKLLIPLELL